MQNCGTIIGAPKLIKDLHFLKPHSLQMKAACNAVEPMAEIPIGNGCGERENSPRAHRRSEGCAVSPPK